MLMTLIDSAMMECTEIYLDSFDSIFFKTTLLTNYRMFMTYKITRMVVVTHETQIFVFTDLH